MKLSFFQKSLIRHPWLIRIIGAIFLLGSPILFPLAFLGEMLEGVLTRLKNFARLYFSFSWSFLVDDFSSITFYDNKEEVEDDMSDIYNQGFRDGREGMRREYPEDDVFSYGDGEHYDYRKGLEDGMRRREIGRELEEEGY